MRVGEGEDRRADTERAPPRNTYAYIAMQKSIGKGIKTRRPKTKTEKTHKEMDSKNPLISFRRSSCRDDLFWGVIFLKPLRPNIDEAPEH